MADKKRHEIIEELSKKFADDGKIITAGWVAFQLAIIHPDAPQSQIDDMRDAYMAGAQHLWASILTIMEAGAEPTESDLKRMSLIDDELKAWVKTKIDN